MESMLGGPMKCCPVSTVVCCGEATVSEERVKRGKVEMNVFEGVYE